MNVYYNDNEPFVCAWLRNLIAAKLLPAGDVDERSIEQVMPDEVRGYTQAHFFAGIGGWPYALQLAGWGDRSVWTGSCPCQPFSLAGQRKTEDDSRHLWPTWFRLIRECEPGRIFGEQVAGAVGQGWWDVVSTELEAEAYTVGAVVLGAHSVGAPHIRQRLFFVADANGAGREDVEGGTRSTDATGRTFTGTQSDAIRVAAESRVGKLGRVEQPEKGNAGRGLSWWITEPAVDRVAYGVPGRVGRLRAYGNAIVPQVAAAFVKAYLDCRP